MAKKAESKGPRSESEALRKNIALARKKLDNLKELGVGKNALEKILRKASEDLKAGREEDCRRGLDELLLFFKLAAEELGMILDRFLEGGKGEAPKKAGEGSRSLLTEEEIEETVEEAFKKALHSTALRRMVEVIALEKVRSVLVEEGPPPAWVEKALSRALSGTKRGARKAGGPR